MSERYTIDEITDTVIILRRRILHEVVLAVHAIEAVHDRADGYHIVTTSGHVYHVRRSALHDAHLRAALGLPS